MTMACPLDMIHRPSPNFGERPNDTLIDSIIIHYTAMDSVAAAIAKFQDSKSDNPVSAHYTICRQGRIFFHVCPSKRAWHAGKSSYRCRENFNDFSIGIELYNPGHNRGYIPYTELQILSLVKLMRYLYTQFPINPKWVLGHSDISPGRKYDPGELFPWERLKKEGLAAPAISS